jgi:WD40 repeat protein
LLATLLCLSGEGASLEGPVEGPEYRFALSEDEWPQCVAFSPDGRKVYAGTNAGKLWTWELKKKAAPKILRLTAGRLLSGPVLCVALSPDGRRALAGCADDKVRVVDLEKAEVTHVLRGHRDPVFSVAFSRDGQHALSGSSGRATIFQWDLKTGRSLHRFQGEEIVDSLAIAPDGRRFLATEFMSIQEWDLQSGERLRSLKGHEARIYALFYSPDGQSIISGGWDGVRVWDVKTGKCLRAVGDREINAHHFALSPDGGRILLGGTKEMQLLDLKEGKELKRWRGLTGNVHVAFSPDGRRALSGEEQGPVSLWVLPEVRKKR